MPIKKSPTVWHEQGMVLDLTSNMIKGLHAIKKLYHKNNKDLYITSGGEGDHLMYSFHYEGNAIDIKKNGIGAIQIETVLGKDFDVIPYSWGFHIEYDPKG